MNLDNEGQVSGWGMINSIIKAYVFASRGDSQSSFKNLTRNITFCSDIGGN